MEAVTSPDPDQIAREIARKYFCHSENVKEAANDIAAALLEYGEACAKDAKDKERASVVQYGKEQRWEARGSALEEFKEIVFTYLRKQVTKGRVSEMIKEIECALIERKKND